MHKCPSCKSENPEGATSCQSCGERLNVSSAKPPAQGSPSFYGRSKNTPQHQHSQKANTYSIGWAILVAWIIPLAGFILGCIYLNRKDDDAAKVVVINSGIAYIVNIVLIVFFWSSIAAIFATNGYPY